MTGNTVKVRFLATKRETSVKRGLLLKPSEWLDRDELVLMQQPGLHNASIYEEVKTVDIVEDAGNLPRYRVRVEAPSIYHKM
ncbi:hypothetical protein RvY_18377 [Ramazzottius varieornatus]|uniref:Uncharacterized protein n=1 Tax=Ramazzottius varieornatus TaxID=947166 RepID=A0A1D1W751_RAMVA|nr:hypothetical protein RvY_18377 [Ramazzottius varieornatus]